MISSISARSVFCILRLSGNLFTTWPPSPNAGKFELIFRNIAWFLVVVNVIVHMTGFSAGAYYFRHDTIRLMKALSELVALIEVLFHLILCRIKRSQLQKLLGQVEKFLEHSEERELIVFQKYVDRYTPFFAFVGSAYFLAAVAFCCGPLVLSTDLPGEAVYPFSIETKAMKRITYATQVIVILHTALSVFVDFTIAILFIFPTAKLEILGAKITNATRKSEIKLCGKQHQEIIQYTEEVQQTVRFILFKTNITMGSAVIFGGIPLLYNESLAVMSQFIFFVLGGMEKLYITAWPADDLKDMSEKISLSVYESSWVDSSPAIKSDLFLMLQRSQKPILIRMGGVFPALTLKYYANFLFTTASYFTTMRAVII